MQMTFKFKPINELIDNNYYDIQRQLTLEELSQYDGNNEKRSIVSIGRQQTLVDTYDFSPDDWIQYITPLVDDALEEADGGVRLEHLFQKYIMIGILVGQGRTFQEAIDEIEEWENTGIANLLDESRRNV